MHTRKYRTRGTTTRRCLRRLLQTLLIWLLLAAAYSWTLTLDFCL